MTMPIQVQSADRNNAPAVGYTFGGFLARFAIYNCIVTAILLPVYASGSFDLTKILRGADKAKESEAKATVGAVNRAQQAYYLEQNRFANAMVELKIGLPNDTKNYQYKVWVPPQQGPMQVAEPNTLPIGAMITARSKDPNLRSVTGVVAVVPEPGDKIKKRTVTGICITSKPSVEPPVLPRLTLIKKLKGQQNLSPSNIRTICPPGSIGR
jgi:type II secretory pathway pseudopilin PulG